MRLNKISKIDELEHILENEEDASDMEVIATSNFNDIHEIVDVLPDYVLGQDNMGNLIYAIEDIKGVTARKVSTKIIGYGLTISNEVVKALNGDRMAFDNLPDFEYFISTVDNSYIGTQETYANVVGSGIIYMENATGRGDTANIGFSTQDQCWAGWSHRGIHYFYLGDRVEEGDITSVSGLTDEYLAEHPEEDMSLPVGFIAHTLNDAKRMAQAFADAVS